MPRSRLLALIAVLAVPVPGAHAQTTEHAVFVSVLDKTNDGPVTGLGVEAFTVREDGRAREVLRASRAGQPIDLVLLVDNSEAASRHVNDLRQSLTRFTARLTAAQNPVALVTIADRPTLVQDYTTSSAALERAVQRIFAQPGSGTTLLDAIGDVSKGLRKRDSERRVILAITTEGTDFSNPNHRRALEHLLESGAAFYAVVLTEPGGGDLRTDEARSRGIVLDEGTSETGGRLVRLLSSMSLTTTLEAIASDLENQYHVVYGRPGALVPPKTVEVGVNRPGATVRWTPAATPARPSTGE